MLNLDWDTSLMESLQDFFNIMEPKSLYLTHYELSKLEDSPSHKAQDWKIFLTDPRVSDYVSEELRLLQQGEMRKMLQDISKNQKSVGTAQNLTALMKYIGSSGSKEGPAFIYTYVPLTSEEAYAPNVQQLTDDPFRREV